MTKKDNPVKTDTLLAMLCDSVIKVLSAATHSSIAYSPMVQKISRTCLRPDIGCFVLFDGSFSGLVIINFSGDSAMEIYRGYMLNMGMPESELARQYTSDEVGNTLGELMNQIVGDFTGKVGKELLVSINQNQPKMLTINKEVMVSIDTNLDHPQARRVSFKTTNRHTFYMEMAMDRTQFIKLHEFQQQESNPDKILAETGQPHEAPNIPSAKANESDLLEELGF